MPICTADYAHEGHQVHLVMAYVPLDRLAARPAWAAVSLALAAAVGILLRRG